VGCLSAHGPYASRPLKGSKVSAPPNDILTPSTTATWRSRIYHQDLRVDVRPGKPGGVPLLLLGGIGVSFEGFDLLVEALDPGIEIIRVDVPGVGGSPTSPLPLGFPQLAWMLAQMLDDLGYRQVDVFGFSWGGALAQQFAAQHRKRCRRLVLVSTSTGIMSIPGNPRVLAKMMRVESFYDPKAAAALLYGGDDAEHTEDVRRLFRHTKVTGISLAYMYQMAAVACWASLPFLWMIRQPCLVIAGEDDAIVPLVNARLLAGLIPHATLHVFAGGHVEPLAAPKDFVPVIAKFLA
jgi:poly(3-hydroxyalkanoate) depolymerase